jgi:hypothetical protein
MAAATYKLRDRDPRRVEATLWSMLEWERVHDRPVYEMNKARDRMWVIWHAAREAGHDVPDDFDGFARLLENIDLEDDEPVRPTDADPTAAE